MYKTFLGIDVGKTGSISILVEGQEPIVYPIPLQDKEYDINKIVEIFSNKIIKPCFAIIERAQCMPKQGIVSSFTFGKGYGILLAILTVMSIPYQIVHSRVWTRVMLDGAPGEGKGRALLVAERLFPSWRPNKKKEWTFADSLLLMEYGRRLYGTYEKTA